MQFLPMLTWGIPVELWFLRFAKRLGIRIVYTVHNVLPQGTGDRRRSIFEKLYRLPDALICHDAVARGRLTQEFAVRRTALRLFLTGLCLHLTASLQRIAPAKSLRSPRIKSWCCGREFCGPKRPFLPAEGVAAGSGKESCRSPAVVGPAERASISAVADEVRTLGIENSVRLDLRFVPERQITLLDSAADVLVYPYSEITTSGALMTGLGYGKAIITTKLERFQSVSTEGRDALMVDYGDVDGLAETILTLAAQPARRHQLSGGQENSQPMAGLA